MQQQPPGAFTFLVHTQRLSGPACLPLQHRPPTRTDAAYAPLTLTCIIISSLQRRGFVSLCHPHAHTRLLTHPPTNTFPPSIRSRAGTHAYLVTQKSTLSLPSTVFQFHFSPSLLLRLSIHPSIHPPPTCLIVSAHTQLPVCVFVCILVHECPPLPSDDSNKAGDCWRWRWGMAPIDDRVSDSLAAS